MALTLIRPGEKLVYSTRWLDPDADRNDAPADLITIEVVIHDKQHDERLEALSQRPNLFNFLKSEVRSRAFA
ncbi:MAG: hypothetical protein BroJett011_76160 [Chloroflexota bacterium]|nr:MAG: hypothetical protein BroJett011_76160 [Chloroflexota bacterium]